MVQMARSMRTRNAMKALWDETLETERTASKIKVVKKKQHPVLRCMCGSTIVAVLIFIALRAGFAGFQVAAPHTHDTLENKDRPHVRRNNRKTAKLNHADASHAPISLSTPVTTPKATILNHDRPLIIAIGTPITSRGTNIMSLRFSPYFTIVLSSFMRISRAKILSKKYKYRFYVGIDKGDPRYDSYDAKSEFHRLFEGQIRKRFRQDQLATALENLELILITYKSKKGSPSWVLSEVFKQAVK